MLEPLRECRSLNAWDGMSPALTLHLFSSLACLCVRSAQLKNAILFGRVVVFSNSSVCAHVSVSLRLDRSVERLPILLEKSVRG